MTTGQRVSQVWLESQPRPSRHPRGKGLRGLSRVGDHLASRAVSCTVTSRKHTAWARGARLRDGGSVSASSQDCLQPEEGSQPLLSARGGRRLGLGPLPTGPPPEPPLTPRLCRPGPSPGAGGQPRAADPPSCSSPRQARVHRLRGRGWNLGLDAHSPKNLAGTGSLLLSLCFVIRRMGRTRPLQRFQVYAKAALLSAGTCAPSSVPFNIPPVGFSSLSRPHPKAVARRRAFQTELHPSSADPAAPGGCSCQAGRPPPRLPRFLGALPAVELSPRGDFPY